MEQDRIVTCFRTFIKEESQKAFAELYHLLFERLFLFCYSLIHSKEGAEEIVNDVFLKVWDKRKTLNHVRNPKGFLYVSTKNKAIDYLRENNPRRIITTCLEESGDQISFDINPEKALIHKELRETLETAIKDLPPRCKLIFKLIKEDGLKYREVADLLNLSIKTVENQMTIALKKLALSLSSKEAIY